MTTDNADAGWQPIVHRGVPCGHTHLTPLGWAVDCGEPAIFVRATRYAYEFACGQHVKEMSTPLEDQ